MEDDDDINLVDEITNQMSGGDPPAEPTDGEPAAFDAPPAGDVAADGAATPETPAEPAADANPDAAFFEMMKDGYGADLSKYGSMDEALRGMVNAMGVVGRHDEDAKLGRRLRENPTEFLQQLGLFQKQEQATPPPAQQDTFVPLSYDEMLTVARLRQENPDAIDADLQQRFKNTTEYLARKNYERAFTQQDNTAPVAQQVLAQVQQMLAQRDQQYAAQQAAQMEMAQWDNANRDIMFTNDGKMTPLGVAWRNQMYAPDATGVSPHDLYQSGRLSAVQAAEYAKHIVLARHAQVAPPVAPPPAAAEHKPNVVNPIPAAGDPNAWNDETESFSEFLTRKFAAHA